MVWNIFLLLAWSCFVHAAPENLGKTHFIVGQSNRTSQPTKHKVATPFKKNASVKAYFAPDSNVKEKLIKHIDEEKKSIQAAVFMLTEPTIAQALTRAKKRGVTVELITDVGCLKERANKVGMLCENGCAVYVYNPPEQQRGQSLMHHKFALFSTPSIVWTGSYNFTKAASNSNQENAVSISDQKTFEKFVAQFERLKKKSYRYSKPART